MIKMIIVSFLFLLSLLSANNVLQEAIDQAKAGSRLVLPAGVYHGNIVIDKPLIIDGKDQKAIIEGDGNISADNIGFKSAGFSRNLAPEPLAAVKNTDIGKFVTLLFADKYRKFRRNFY